MATRLVGVDQGLQAGFPASWPRLFPEPNGENWVCFTAGLTAVQTDMTMEEARAQGAGELSGAEQCCLPATAEWRG